MIGINKNSISFYIRFVQVLFLYIFFIQISYSAQSSPLAAISVEDSYILKEEPLPKFLKRFFTDHGLRVVISDRVKANRYTLNGHRKGFPEQILQSIKNSNGLLTYFDGTSVYVYRADEMSNRFILIPPEKIAAVKRALRRKLFANNDNFTRIDMSASLVEVTGVPRYINTIEQLIQVVTHQEKTVFKYIPLKYAWASDRTFIAGDRQVTVPGVANLLRQILEGQTYSDRTEVLLPSASKSLRGKGLAALGPKNKNRRLVDIGDNRILDISENIDDIEYDSLIQPSNEIAGTGDNPIARIVADQYRNAIIIRDLQERMSLYEELIRALDVPTQVVEIEASIIEIDTKKLKEVGVEWFYGKDTRQVGFSPNGSGFVQAIAEGGAQILDSGPGLHYGAILGGDNKFTAHINLLEENGVAKVTSTPKVATLNDLEAVIESSRSLYVPVEGAYDTDLFKVFAGTVLRVTPHIIEDDEQSRIRLVVSVEDGNFTEDSELPETTRNAVLTQVVIDSGESLLLGGLNTKEVRTKTTKVPVLGDIPLMGQLFRSEEKINDFTERLFLISPRLLLTDATQQFGKSPNNKLNDKDVNLTSNQEDVIESKVETCKDDCGENITSQTLYMF